jgi:hypothetical protein
VAGTLALPATTHLHQLIRRTPPSHCPGCRRKRTSWCSVMIIRRLAGTCHTETCLLAGPPCDTLPSASADRQLLVVGSPYAARNGRAGSVQSRPEFDLATRPIAVIPQQHPRSATPDWGWRALAASVRRHSSHAPARHPRIDQRGSRSAAAVSRTRDRSDRPITHEMPRARPPAQLLVTPIANDPRLTHTPAGLARPRETYAITSLPRCMPHPVMATAGDRICSYSHCPPQGSALTTTASTVAGSCEPRHAPLIRRVLHYRRPADRRQAAAAGLSHAPQSLRSTPFRVPNQSVAFTECGQHCDREPLEPAFPVGPFFAKYRLGI